MIKGLFKSLIQDNGAEGTFVVYEGFSVRSEDIPNEQGNVETHTSFQAWFKIYRDETWYDAGKRHLDRRAFSADPVLLNGLTFTLDPELNREWIYQNAAAMFAELAGATTVESV